MDVTDGDIPPIITPECASILSELYATKSVEDSAVARGGERLGISFCP